jgi:hypothetical protein
MNLEFTPEAALPPPYNSPATVSPRDAGGFNFYCFSRNQNLPVRIQSLGARLCALSLAGIPSLPQTTCPRRSYKAQLELRLRLDQRHGLSQCHKSPLGFDAAESENGPRNKAKFTFFIFSLFESHKFSAARKKISINGLPLATGTKTHPSNRV